MQASAAGRCVPRHPLWEPVQAAVRAMGTVYYNVVLLPVPGQSKAQHLCISTARELRIIFTFLNAQEKNISCCASYMASGSIKKVSTQHKHPLRRAACGCFRASMAAEWLHLRLYGPQSLTYLLSGPLQ